MSNVYDGKKRYILWTGGFDSTFMLLQFARQEMVIHPIYVIDPSRKSKEYEMIAMEKILGLLHTKYSDDVKATILPIKKYELNDITKDEYLTSCYDQLTKRIKIGSQYEWLSRLASMYPFLDIGVEKHIEAYGGCTAAIQNDGGFIIENGIGRLNAEKSSAETISLFGKYRFPIITLTGLDMLALIHSWGWDEIIKHVWFCHEPIDGKPCGMCRPCQQKMDDCMDELLPKMAQRRYKVYTVTKNIIGDRFANKLSRIYRKLIK